MTSPGTLTHASRPLLEVDNLRVGFPSAGGNKAIVDGLSLRVNAGEIVALVGESGSGKSLSAMSMVRLLPTGARVMGGKVLFDGQDVMALSSRALDQLRGGRIAMLFQQPHLMLDPTSRVGVQVAEPARLHAHLSRLAAQERVVELLREVGIPEPRLRARAYSHELSGGMAQRVMIAAALSGNPDLLIADEPTTALDVTVQAQILRLLDEERRRRGLAILLITHDLAVVSALADRVAVMYAGRIVEEGPAAHILRHPQHPYTQALIRCSLLQPDQDGTLYSIAATASSPQELECGCRFHPRCAVAATSGNAGRCASNEPTLAIYDDGCSARCWAVGEAPDLHRAMPSLAQDNAQGAVQ
jgi:peptide/nickel transport system ATP-binding protein